MGWRTCLWSFPSAAMVQRITYRRQTPYNTKSNRTRFLRTPGGRLQIHTVKKKPSGPKCGDCKKRLLGIPALRPTEYKRLKKRDRKVNRAYGGHHCGPCVRSRIVRAFLIEEQKCVKQVLAEKLNQAKEPKRSKK